MSEALTFCLFNDIRKQLVGNLLRETLLEEWICVCIMSFLGNGISQVVEILAEGKYLPIINNQ